MDEHRSTLEPLGIVPVTIVWRAAHTSILLLLVLLLPLSETYALHWWTCRGRGRRARARARPKTIMSYMDMLSKTPTGKTKVTHCITSALRFSALVGPVGGIFLGTRTHTRSEESCCTGGFCRPDNE